jgi:hypothetical protein
MPAVNLLARGYRLEVSADGATNWLKLGGLNDLSDQISPNKVDSSNYDSDGWAASEITLQSWSVTAKYNRQSSAGVTDAASELLRQARGQFGDSARVYVRWYSTVQTSEPGWQGRAIVEVNKSKTGVADLNEFTATLTGDGALSSIANPYVPASVPSILSASPSGVAAGGQVEIRGTGFTGTVSTTGVKFGATNATSWIVVSDQEIVAVMPAGTAGAANIVVTNATGASSAFSYTRG